MVSGDHLTTTMLCLIRPPDGKWSNGKNDADIALSKGLYEQIPAYMAAKYAADKDLSQRTAFKWTVVRPGWLSDAPGTGKITAGRTYITASIPVSVFPRQNSLLLLDHFPSFCLHVALDV